MRPPLRLPYADLTHLPPPDPAPVLNLGANIIPVEQLYRLPSIKFGEKTWKFKVKFSNENAP